MSRVHSKRVNLANLASVSALYQALSSDTPRKRGKAAYKMEVERVKGMVNWTCPQCGARNKHKNFGREYHFCWKCGLDTDVK